jgi:hypothetical protein
MLLRRPSGDKAAHISPGPNPAIFLSFLKDRTLAKVSPALLGTCTRQRLLPLPTPRGSWQPGSMLQTYLGRLRIIPMSLPGSQVCLRTTLLPRGASFLFQRCFQRPVRLVFGLTWSLLRTRFRLAIRLRVISVLGCATPRVASCIARLAIMLSRGPAVAFRPRTVLPAQAAVLILFGTPVPLLLPVMMRFPLSGGHHRPWRSHCLRTMHPPCHRSLTSLPIRRAMFRLLLLGSRRKGKAAILHPTSIGPSAPM